MSTATTDTAPSRMTELLTERSHNAVQKGKRLTKTLEFRVIVMLLVVLAIWGLAIATFGYPALILPVLAMVPTMFFILLLITVGK